MCVHVHAIVCVGGDEGVHVGMGVGVGVPLTMHMYVRARMHVLCTASVGLLPSVDTVRVYMGAGMRACGHM